MNFSTTPAGGVTNDSQRIGDVLAFTRTITTDPFVLQLSYSEAAAIGAYGSESFVFLGWNNGGTWVNAVAGNTGNNAIGAQQGFSGSFALFQSTYGSTISSYLGAWGRDTTANTVWAVLNHNSEFATVPEPSTYVLLLGGLGLLAWLRRRKVA